MQFKVVQHNRTLGWVLKHFGLKLNQNGCLKLKHILQNPAKYGVVPYGKAFDSTIPSCPVSKYYHVAQPLVDKKYEQALNSFKTINVSWYVDHYQQFVDDLPMLRDVDRFMLMRAELLKTPVTIRQRAFQIFQDEKAFDHGRGRKLFERVTGLAVGLNMHETFMPISVWSNESDPQAILISENLDPFYELQQALRASMPICGQLVDGLVYGGGNGLYTSLRDPYFDQSLLAGKQIYYVGDIDVKGILMLANWQNYAQQYQKITIKPAVEIYRRMINKGQQYNHLSPVKKDTQRKFKGFDTLAMCNFLSLFGEDDQQYLQQVLPAYRIPQEILTRKDYE